MREGIENEDNRRLTARDKFRVDTFAVILDSLRAELERRKQAYAEFHERFQVFSSCVDSPLTRFAILLRILKRLSLRIWKKTSLMKWFVSLVA